MSSAEPGNQTVVQRWETDIGTSVLLPSGDGLKGLELLKFRDCAPWILNLSFLEVRTRQVLPPPSLLERTRRRSGEPSPGSAVTVQSEADLGSESRETESWSLIQLLSAMSITQKPFLPSTWPHLLGCLQWCLLGPHHS